MICVFSALAGGENIFVNEDSTVLSVLEFVVAEDSSEIAETYVVERGSADSARFDALDFIIGIEEEAERFDFEGRYLTPKRITSGFGFRRLFNRMHRGVDVAMAVGDSIFVPFDGHVESVGYDADGYGLFIKISHKGGIETTYGHLLRSLVFPGETVVAGAPIGLSGNSGHSTGPHLHFEIRMNGVPVDPTTMINVTPVQSPVCTHIVREGDTLENIAEKYRIPVYRLCIINFLKDNAPLKPGMVLKLR